MEKRFSGLQFIISCEHASNQIPQKERTYLKIPSRILKSHRAWDLGARSVAEQMKLGPHTHIIMGKYTRLLCDLNRTEDNKNVFSEYSKILTLDERKRVLNSYHTPYWENVIKLLKKKRGRKDLVVHLGIHSFVPVFNGYRRPTDVGILYDPSRAPEKLLARAWQKKLTLRTQRAIHLNLPYRGTGNGLISSLRLQNPESSYLGFEIELNQSLLTSLKSRKYWAETLSTTLEEVLRDLSNQILGFRLT